MKIPKITPLKIGAAGIFTAAMLIAADRIMDIQLHRGGYPDRRFSVNKRFTDFGRTRKTVRFSSGDNVLKGYIYGGDASKGLIVFAHGIFAAHESYIGILMRLVDDGWTVFAYDATGCGESDGRNSVSLVQSAADLDAALSYVSGNRELSALPLFIMGHSWGGFASAAVSGIRHRDIKGIVSVSGYAYPEQMLSLGAEYALGKPIAALVVPFGKIVHRLRSGRLASLNAIDSVNSSDVPILIIHGEHDDYVDYRRVSIISKRDRITNGKAQFMTMKGIYADHVRLLYSDSTNKYRERLKAELDRLTEEHGGELPEEMHENFIRCADKELANEPNPELIEAAEDFFEKCL
ncbi:MAG: alpha/beta fold hydrolase [Oscillospiraceae bacterium]|nr:alpha/beta fold hydrolase [Oscillospiraceae bacterium]